jgi:ThiF family
MSQKLISLSLDLSQLRSEGFDIEIRGSYLLMKDVPYVNAKREVKRGILVSTLNLAGDVTTRPDNHQVQLVGDYPCHADGSQMTELVSQSIETKLDKNLTTNHWFSQKPKIGFYANYYEKMTTYAAILVSQAQVIDPEAKSQTYRVDEPDPEDSPFTYLDTASSRAEINLITQKLALESVAIIGLGGTGSYILDLVAKTPVKAIHIFDGDKMSTHNAFRSPGAPSVEELREQPLKVAYFKQRYCKMHRGIITHEYHVDASNVDELRAIKFVFLSIDDGEAKRTIVQKLEEFGISFIDVGMGLYAKDEMLGGILRVTTSTLELRAHVHEKGRISFGKNAGDAIYDKNIQIADLNALNATLAVIKWKKLFAFYADNEKELFSTYTIDCNMLTSEDML